MTSFNIVKYDTFNTEYLQTRDVVTLKSGMKRISTKYGSNGGNGFRTQTPKMLQIFDLNEHSQDNGETKYSFCLTFRGSDEDPKVAKFQKMVEDIDEFNINYATENSKELFGKQTKREIVEEFHKPMVKFSNKKNSEGEDYPPTLKVKLPFKNGKPKFNIFDKNRKPMNLHDIDEDCVNLSMFSQNTKMQCILEYSGMWVVAKQFGSSWNLIQAKVFQEENLENCAILDSDDEGDDDDKGSTAGSTAGSTERLDDDDAEGDGGETF